MMTVQRTRGSYRGKDTADIGGVLGLLTANGGVRFLVVSLLVMYVVGPLLVYFFVFARAEYLELATQTVIAVLGVWVGSKLTWLDKRVAGGLPKFAVNSATYVNAVGLLFVAYIIVTLATAPSVPLLSAMAGSDANTLSAERGEFLKGRDGPWLLLLYLSSIFTSTVVPYGLVLAYQCKNRFRHALGFVFMFFAVSFLVKALFLNVLIPLIAYAIESGRLRRSHLIYAGGGSVGLLLVMISLSGFGEGGTSSVFSLQDFFSVSFASSSSWQFLLYRALAVPVFTAVDTLTVHATQFGGNLLMGATSSFVAALTGQERINLERFVFEYQFGGWNDFANSNVVFVVDAFVNFGWLGVFLIGTMVGLSLRMLRKSTDLAFRSLTPLYVFLLVSSPFIGMLLSNGFLLLFLQVLFIRVKVRDVT